jgi:glycosidase
MKLLRNLCLLTLLMLYAVEHGIAQQDVTSPTFIIPDRRDVSLYQVNTRSFSAEGNLKGVIARLDSIKALGINVIYIMPVYPVGKVNSVNSPYCIQDYTAIGKEFGSMDDLKALVDAAHQKKMGVLMDWVANHTSYDHVWMKNKSWYKQDSTGKIISPPGMGWNDVAQLDFNNQEMRLEMIKSMKYWLDNANIDGFRCDYSDGPPFDFWKQAIESLRSSVGNKKLLMMSEGTRPDHFKAGFDYNFGFRFFENMKKIYADNKSVLSIDSLNKADRKGAANGQQFIRYTSNHDVNSSDGTSLELFGGKKGEMAAFVVVAYMQSIPMIYNGQEVGTPYRLSFPFTGKEIDWRTEPEQTAAYKKILAARNESEAIRRGKLKSFSSEDVCVFTRESGKEKVLVLSNLRDKQVTYTIKPALKRTNWKDVFSGKPKNLTSSIVLEPYQYLVLKN